MTQKSQPTPLDRGFQLAFWVAHRLLRVTWMLRRPRTGGALVALWHDGKLLLVKNSYRTQFTLPGGYVKAGESEADAAARELQEEVGITCPASSLKVVYRGEHPFEFRRDALVILEGAATDLPAPRLDHREVVWAGLKTPAEVLSMPIVPHLREYLLQRLSA